MMDTGTSTGDISGHSKVSCGRYAPALSYAVFAKAINAVSIRHQRPFRAATAADDALIVFHQGTQSQLLSPTSPPSFSISGTPYKYDKVGTCHPQSPYRPTLSILSRQSKPTPSSCKMFDTRYRGISLPVLDPMQRYSYTMERLATRWVSSRIARTKEA